MLPKIIYKQAYKDIFYAFINKEFTTEQLIENLKAVRIELEKDYGKDVNVFE